MTKDTVFDLTEILQEFADKGMAIKIASQGRVALLTTEVDRLLEALGYAGALVTDESIIGHFPLDEGELAQASAELGVPLQEGDYLCEVAARVLARRLGGL